MLFRLIYEGAVGAITLIAMLLFGEAGFAAFALLALLPVIWRVKKFPKPDERELQLFYQTNNWTLIFTIFVMLLIYEYPNVAIGGVIVGELWFPLSIAAMLLGRGIVGLVLFHNR